MSHNLKSILERVLKKCHEVGLAKGVVIRLTAALHGKSYKIYVNNFFSSVNLFYYLKQNLVSYCGTIQSNRKNMPELLADKLMKRGDFDWRMDLSGLSVTKWIDNRPVYFI